MIQIFKYIIDIWLIPINAMFDLNLTFDNNTINVGILFSSAIIIFRSIWMLLECLGILGYIRNDEED